MTRERWRQVKQIYSQVREEAPDRQAALVEGLCGDDPELRAEVVSLLSHGKQASGFLEAPAVAVLDERRASEAIGEVAGRTIGSYTVIREIASGGMGIVYEARQDQPDRVVALKVMNAGIASRSAPHRRRPTFTE